MQRYWEEVVHTEGSGEAIVKCHVGQHQNLQVADSVDCYLKGKASCGVGLHFDLHQASSAYNLIVEVGNSHSWYLEISVNDCG